MTGPNLRATGVPFDVRRAHPYSVYPELDFDIPTRSEGDCLARYLLRMDEIKQSLRIIDQCLHQMPDGPVMAKLPRLLRPRPGRAYAGIEGPRGQYAAYVDQRRDRPAVPDADPRPVVHPPPGGRRDDARAPRSPTPWPSWHPWTPSWAASTSDGCLPTRHWTADAHVPFRALHARQLRMTVIARSWNRLTLPGKVVFTIVPLLIAAHDRRHRGHRGLRAGDRELLANNLPIVRFVVAATAVLLMTIPTAFLIIYMEMKVIALMNLRIGPDRVGPFGSLLSVVHGLKVLMKEDFTPTGADSLVFTWAPVVVYLASVMTLLVIPFAPGLFGVDINLGAALLLRDRRPVGRRAADGRLVELQQVLAARRAACRRPGRELRDPPHAVGRRAAAPGRHDEPQSRSSRTSRAGSRTGTSSSSRSAR